MVRGMELLGMQACRCCPDHLPVDLGAHPPQRSAPRTQALTLAHAGSAGCRCRTVRAAGNKAGELVGASHEKLKALIAKYEH